MRLKILVVPFFLVMMLILSIGFIKPDFDDILTRKADIASHDVLIAHMDSILANIRSLNSSLDREQESEKFLLHYLPYTLDQDQTIDAFNYLANQSGIIITEMDLKTSPETIRADVASDGSALANPNVEAKTFVLTGSVFGSYENIKAFFDRLTHVSRFQKIQLFSIQKDDQTASAAKKGNTTDLKGTFAAEYGYLPKQRTISALTMPVFLKSEINFSEVALLRDKITSIPTLEKGQAGKPNPFQ